MDSLASLPPKNDTVKTPEEEEIMKQLFPEPSKNNEENQKSGNTGGELSPSNTPSAQKNAPPAKINWKLIGATVGAFLLFANPWVDGILSKIPYCSGTASIIGIKVILFSIILILLNIYM